MGRANEGTGGTDTPPSIGRRSALRGAVATLSLAGVAGLGRRVAAGGGDDGDYEAPDDYPLISTRGHFDDDGNYTSDATKYNYYGEGDWARYTESWHDEVIVFVHGYDVTTDDDQDINIPYTAELAFEENDTYETNVGYSWDSDTDWGTAVHIAKKNGRKLASWVADHNDRGGDPVRVVGHSLGAQVVVSAVSQLAAWDRSNAIKECVLLGAAIGDRSVALEGDYGYDVQESVYSFSNYYKTDDDVLDTWYTMATWDTALGEEGIQDGTSPPYNYREGDVSYVPDHGSYYEPYEGCIPDVVANM
jgi:pimeloyl-ACP methyl ester carboxylesterase